MENPEIAASQEVEAELPKTLEGAVGEEATVPAESPPSQVSPETPAEKSPTDDELAARLKIAQGKPQGPEMPVPRENAEIQKDYDFICRIAGEAFFERETHDNNLKMMFQRYAGITREAAARDKLDKKAAEEKFSKAEAKRARKAQKNISPNSEEPGATSQAPASPPVEPMPSAETISPEAVDAAEGLSE